jgi:hypothetical protein
LLLAGVLLLRTPCDELETAGVFPVACSVALTRLFLTETVVCCCLLLLTASRLTALPLFRTLPLAGWLVTVLLLLLRTVLFPEGVALELGATVWLLARTEVCPALVGCWETAGLFRTLVDWPLFPDAVRPLLLPVAEEWTEALRTDCW